MENKELFEALAKAQSQFKPAEMDKINPHFKSKYASLASVQDVYRKPLSDNGLSIIQNIVYQDSCYFLVTNLNHSSGQSISSSFKLMLNRQDMQGLGASITYARRYAISSMIGIVSDEDDDGNSASEAPKKEFKPIPKPAQKNIPNKAPIKEPEPMDDFDVALMKPSFLDELVKFTKDHAIPAVKVSEAIEFITGEPRRASTLSDDELNEVLNYLALKYV